MNGSAFDSKSILGDQKQYLEIQNTIEESSIEPINILNSIYTMFGDARITASEGMCVIEDKYVCVCYYLTEDPDNKKLLMIYDLENQIIASTTTFYKEDSSSPDSGTNVDLGHVNSLSYCNGYLYATTLSPNYDIIELSINLNDFNIQFSRRLTSSYYISSAVKYEESFYLYVSNYNNKVALLKSDNNLNSLELVFYLDEIFGTGDTSQGLEYDGEYFYFATSTTAQGIGSDATIYDLTRYLRETIHVLNKKGEIVKYLWYPRGDGTEIEDISVLRYNNQKFLIINPNVDNNCAFLYLHQLNHVEYTPHWLRCRSISNNPLWGGHTNYYYLQPETLHEIKDNDPWATGTSGRPMLSIEQIMWIYRRNLNSKQTIIRLNPGHYGQLKLDNCNTLRFFY